MNVLRQVLGVDVAQKELVVTLGRLSQDLTTELYSRRKFANKESGFDALLKWLKKHTVADFQLHVVMEATGVYHQKFAYFLDENGIDLSVVLPNKISNYMRTLSIKTITDATCADAIALFGLERKLENWKRPKKLYKTLQQLTRERDQIVSERVMIKNQIHAEESEAEPNKRSLDRLNVRLRLMDQQEKEIKTDINECLKKDHSVKEVVDRICTIPGVGILTAVTILGETNGFELIRNKKQLTSYAGLDVKEKQSGTSIKGKSRISKKGNRHLRKAMHLPALTAIRHDERYKELFARLVSRHGIKMKAVVAVQRKLLELTYILFINQMIYDAEKLSLNEKEQQLQ
ncbi:IS110 family transposase [Fluviicola taffensis]|uniref:IS110 family transposase n=1 Tax=Fluviicola taffensis TaxID=191579 RepID=UPI003137CE25